MSDPFSGAIAAIGASGSTGGNNQACSPEYQFRCSPSEATFWRSAMPRSREVVLVGPARLGAGPKQATSLATSARQKTAVWRQSRSGSATKSQPPMFEAGRRVSFAALGAEISAVVRIEPQKLPGEGSESAVPCPLKALTGSPVRRGHTSLQKLPRRPSPTQQDPVAV